MSYSNSYQSNIGIIPSLDAGFRNLTVNSAIIRNGIEPETDNLVDIGRPSKRFRSAYIDDLDMDRTGSINKVPVEAISGSVRNKFQAQLNQLRTIFVQPAPNFISDTSSFISSVVLDTTRRVLVAIGSTVAGTNFVSYASSSIDVDDTVWSLAHTNTLTTGAGKFNPKFLAYDSINDVFIAFNHTVTATSQTQYYTCVGSDLTAWTARTFSAHARATGLAFHNVDDVSYIIVTTEVTTGVFNMFYSRDGGTTFTQFNTVNTPFVDSVGTVLTDTTINNLICDFLQRPDWSLGDGDRFLIITPTFTGNSTTVWRSDNVLGPYYAKGNYGSSGNVRAALYNPYYKTLNVIKRATSNFTYFNYTPGSAYQATTPISYAVTHFGLTNSSPYLVSLQNNSYLPQLKYHVYSLAVLPSQGSISSVYWDGQSNAKVIDGNFGTVTPSHTSLNSPWTFDFTNNVGYTAYKASNISTFASNSNMCILSMSFLYPSRILSQSTTNNTLNNLTSSTRMVIDRFDRLAVKSTDKITGGVGTATYPAKSVFFNNAIRSVGRDSRINQYSSSSNNILGSVNADIGYISPVSLAKATISFNALKTRNWASTTTSAIFTNANWKSTRFVKELNRLYAIGIAGPANAIDINYTTDGGATWMNSGYIPIPSASAVSAAYQADIAYSPVFNTLVLTSGYAGNSISSGGFTTFYSLDDGMTWLQCKITILPNTSVSYGRVMWIAEYGNCGMFVMFALQHNHSGTPAQLILLSEDGINWRHPNSFPAGIVFTTPNRIFCQAAYDPSRKTLAATYVPVLSGSNGLVVYTQDGDTWVTVDTSRMISIYAKDIIIQTGVNDKIDFSVNGGGTLTSTLTAATYSPGALAIHIGKTMTTTSGSFDFYASYSYTSGKFTIQISNLLNLSTASTFQLLWASGPNATTTPYADLGWTLVDTVAASSASSASTVFYTTNSAIVNNVIDLKKTAGPVLYTVYLIPGVYSVINSSLFYTHLQTRMNVPWVAGGNGAFTVSFNTTTGIFTFASSTAFEILWLTGANNAKCPFAECGFAKVDTASTTSRVSTVSMMYISAGSHRSLAYSPSLDIWVLAGSLVGAGSPASTNLHWTKNITAVVGTKSDSGWTGVNVFLNDGVTRPNFADIIWCESLQLFLLLNTNTAAASPNDRNIWISKDGKSFSAITITSSPKTTVTSVDALWAARLSWDTISNALNIDTITPASTLTYYSFAALIRNELVPMPGCQYGVFNSATVTPAAGTVTAYTVTFDTPFTVAPTHVLVSVQSSGVGINDQVTAQVTSTSTTGITVEVSGASGSAGGGVAPSFQWIAWERV
jgi:hypothetical protein